MEKWQPLYVENIQKIQNELGSRYKADIKKAGDRQFVHAEWEKDILKEINILQNDSLPYRGQIFTITTIIEDMQKRDKKLYFDSAFEEITKDYTPEEKEIIIEKISKIEAYSFFYRMDLPYAKEKIKDKKLTENDLIRNFKMGFPKNDTIPFQIEDEPEQNNESQMETKDKNTGNSEFTTRRQVLAIHYLLKVANSKDNIPSEKTRFIQFMTGKEINTAKTKDTYIYKIVANPLPKSDKRVSQDLQFVRNFFENMGIQSVIDEINKEIRSRE